MARHARLQFEGALYHVTFRGNERRDIFRDDADRVRFLESLAERVESYEVRLYLYCLMSNHVHLLVETPRGNLSAFIGSLLTSYSTYFNRRHRRSGHLTQSRYESPVVEGDAYLLKLSRYIHLNPVCIAAWKNRRVRERLQALRDYRWSTYRSYIGMAAREPFVEYAPTLAMVPGPSGTREGAYRAYVETCLASTDNELREALNRSDLAIGSTQYVQDLEALHAREGGSRIRREDLSLRRSKPEVTVEKVIAGVCQFYGIEKSHVMRRGYGDACRPVLAGLLTRLAGLTQRQVADYLNVKTGAAICLQLRKLQGKDGSSLCRDMARIEKNLKT